MTTFLVEEHPLRVKHRPTTTISLTMRLLPTKHWLTRGSMNFVIKSTTYFYKLQSMLRGILGKHGQFYESCIKTTGLLKKKPSKHGFGKKPLAFGVSVKSLSQVTPPQLAFKKSQGPSSESYLNRLEVLFDVPLFMVLTYIVKDRKYVE